MIWLYIYMYVGFPSGPGGKQPACQCKRHKKCWFDSWVGRIPWRRAWQPTPVFLPGDSHGQRSLAGYSPWGRKELDTTEATEQAHMHAYVCMCLYSFFPIISHYSLFQYIEYRSVCYRENSCLSILYRAMCIC